MKSPLVGCRTGTEAATIALIVLLGSSHAGSAQSAEELAADCAAAGGNATLCAVGAGAGRDLAGYISLLSGPGTAVPGQASTLGMRIGGAPRFGISVRAAGVSVVVPDLSDAAGSRAVSSFVPSGELALALGVFEGLNLLPTVGGFLSIDVFASGSTSLFSTADGFDGKLGVLSLGARLGLLRESFTLPAVTVSFSRRFSGELAFGDVSTGDLAEIGADPGVTSLRATVGKDLFAFGVLAGVGWDDFSSATTLRVTNGGGGFTLHDSDVEDSRSSYFVGLSRQLGILSWFSAEVGWLSGFGPVAGGGGSSPDPGRQVYGSIALVLRL